MALLDVTGLDLRYGRIHAVRGLDLVVDEGRIAAVLGANGAGKSSLLRALIGAERIAGGRVGFAGEDITRLPPSARVARGMVLVPEGRRILVTLTVEENLLVGAHLRRDGATVRRDLEAVYARFANLAERRHLAASCLSGGEQQMLAIGRALLARPRLLMLDEPSLGLSPILVDRLFDLIAELNRDGLSILLVEQNTRKALEVAHTGLVMELGRVAMSGDPAMLASDPRLQAAYLGQGAEAAPRRAVS